jgi:PhoPQ-activated pathogenicity-related protein
VLAAQKCDAPAYFLHASGDEFIVPQNSKDNFDAYKGEAKVYKQCPGDHNSERPPHKVTEICEHFKSKML